MKLRSLWLSCLVMSVWIFLAGCHDKETEPTPLTITSFSPTSGAYGASVTIQGTGFANEPEGNIVKFSGIKATVTRAQTNELTVTVPEEAITGKIIVSVNGKLTTSASDFTINQRAPVVTSISPEKGIENTEVTITGQRFVAGSNVYFGGVKSSLVTFVNSTTLKAKVPADALNGKIKVVAGELEGESAATFLTAPRITAISATEGVEGGEITITGANFGTGKTDNAILFGTGAAVESEIIQTSPNELKVKAPVAGTDGKISITSAGFTVESASAFTYQSNIIDFSPKYIKKGDETTVVTLTGTRFNSNPLVSINGITMIIKTKSATQITFTVRNDPAVTGDKITLKGGGTYQSKDEFVITNVWKKINDGASVNQTLSRTTSFEWNGKIFYGLGNNGSSYVKTFHIYDPATNAWSTGPSLHSTAPGREGAYCVRYGNKIYLGMGYSSVSNGFLGYERDWWSYDPTKAADAAWTQLKDYPAVAPDYTGYGTSFVLRDRIYVGFGVNNSTLREYLPALDTWGSPFSTWSDSRTFLVSFVTNDKVYIGCGDKPGGPTFDFVSYDPASSSPNARIAPYPGARGYGSNKVFFYNGEHYIMDSYYLYRFNKATENWTRIDDYSAAPLVLEQTQVVSNRIFGIKGDHSVYEYIPAR